MTMRAGAAVLLCAFLVIPGSLSPQERDIDTIIYRGAGYRLYPGTLEEPPPVPSPLTLECGMELVVAFTKAGRYALVPVTVENGEAYLYTEYGKGKQLKVDAEDFPTLARTGLHSEAELDRTLKITGRPISEITESGRPGRSSGEGFISEEEDIISVLKGDNRLVSTMGLTHPEMARPLFHLWNAVLRMAEAYRYHATSWDDLDYLLYNGRKIYLRTEATKGWQESIFHDEIHGGFHIHIHRELDQKEKELLSRRYDYLKATQVEEFIKKLSHIHTGEMEPYYVMRYGFYEGHTGYRVDPIAVAFVFGLRNLEDIESAFSGRLERALTEHHTKERVSN